MNTQRVLRISALGLLLLITTLLCLRQIGEPDVWWQIKTGQHILEHGTVPKVDVFSYTYQGAEWINVKWLTEVVMALVSDNLEPEFLPLLQWAAMLFILFLLLKSIRELKFALNLKSGRTAPGTVLALLLFVLGLAYRLNTRPEIVSFLFTACFLYLFTRFWNRRDNAVWLLIPIQLLWANMHEAYGVGIVILLLFTGSNWVRYYLLSPPERHPLLKPYTRLSIAAVLAILACGIHPNGIQMITHPFEIFGQLQSNKFTTELLDYRNAEFWQLPAYIMLGFLLLSLVFIFLPVGNTIWKSAGIGVAVIFFAFLYLSFQAFRNIPFFLLVSTPFVAVLLDRIIPEGTGTSTATLLVLVICYGWIGTGKFYDTFLPREKYGLRIDPSRNPIGAAQFIKAHQIEGNAFLDYFNSSFFLWYLPDFKTYIDLRDLDIFEANFISNVFRAYVNPKMSTKRGVGLWELMDRTDNFNYIVMINRAEFNNFHKHIQELENWKMVYVDLNATVYLKTTGANLPVIEEVERDSFEEYFRHYQSLETPAAAVFISRFFWPAYEPVDYSKIDYSEGKQALQEQVF